MTITEDVVSSTGENPVVENEVPVIEAPVNDDLWADIDTLLQSIMETEIITEPTFFPTKEEEQIEEVITDDSLLNEDDEKILDDLEESFKELETELEERDTEIVSLWETISTLETDMKTYQEQAERYSNALDILWDHPVLWILNEKLLKWEAIDIPDYLNKMAMEEISALPNMENIVGEITGVKEAESLQDRLVKKAKQSY